MGAEQNWLRAVFNTKAGGPYRNQPIYFVMNLSSNMGTAQPDLVDLSARPWTPGRLTARMWDMSEADCGACFRPIVGHISARLWGMSQPACGHLTGRMVALLRPVLGISHFAMRGLFKCCDWSAPHTVEMPLCNVSAASYDILSR